jgi:hypothetical protein
MQTFCQQNDASVPQRVHRYRAIRTSILMQAVGSPDKYRGAPSRHDTVLIDAGEPVQCVGHVPWVAKLLLPIGWRHQGRLIEAGIVRWFEDVVHNRRPARVDGLDGVRILREQQVGLVNADALLSRALLVPNPGVASNFLLTDV